MKQNKKPKQTLESAQYGLEINFNISICLLDHAYEVPFANMEMDAKGGRKCL